MNNELKEANNILAAAIYTPSVHGNKFNYKIARDIQEKQLKIQK